MTSPPLPEQIELHRDRMWRRDEDLRVESAVDAERFIEDVGFAKLRSLTPALSQWEREPAAERCSSRRSIAPTSRCAIAAMLACPAASRKGGRRMKGRASPGRRRIFDPHQAMDPTRRHQPLTTEVTVRVNASGLPTSAELSRFASRSLSTTSITILQESL
jgi:hypothetical protein